MTADELNRKISERLNEWSFNDYDGSRNPRNWHSPANAMTLLREMTDKVSVEIEPFNGNVLIDVAFPSIVNIKGSLESAICQAWLKWNEAK